MTLSSMCTTNDSGLFCIMGSHNMKDAAHGLFGEEARNAKKVVNIASHSVSIG